MFKTRSLCILFLFVATSLVHADVYRCEENGSLIFTDNLANFSPSCQAEIVSEVPSLNATAFESAKPVKERAKPIRPTEAAEQKQQNDIEGAYEAFKEEVEILVDKFVSKRKRVFRSTLTKDKQKARRELMEVQSQKNLLINEIGESKLNRSQKTELKTKLSAITD